jgi:hypothetical protein
LQEELYHAAKGRRKIASGSEQCVKVGRRARRQLQSIHLMQIRQRGDDPG